MEQEFNSTKKKGKKGLKVGREKTNYRSFCHSEFSIRHLCDEHATNAYQGGGTVRSKVRCGHPLVPFAGKPPGSTTHTITPVLSAGFVMPFFLAVSQIENLEWRAQTE